MSFFKFIAAAMFPLNSPMKAIVELSLPVNMTRLLDVDFITHIVYT